MEEQGYITPPGYYDLPSIYVYDGDSLTNGTDPQNLSMTIQQDSDFIVRRFTGLETLANKIQLRSAIDNPWSEGPVHFLYDYAVIPERQYPLGSFVGFDLYTVAKLVNAGAMGEADVPYPQLVFQGVKRYKGYRPPVAESSYRYYPCSYTYQMDVVVNWLYYVDPVTGGATNIPRQFVLPVTNWDFELCQISVARYDGVDCSTDLKIQLFDKDNTAFFSNPVLLQFLQDNDNNNKYNGVFPVPSVLYVDGTEIKFNVTSMLTNTSTLPITYSFSFKGMRRRKIYE